MCAVFVKVAQNIFHIPGAHFYTHYKRLHSLTLCTVARALSSVAKQSLFLQTRFKAAKGSYFFIFIFKVI